MLMPFISPRDLGEWSYLGLQATGGAFLTLPSGLQTGDFAILMATATDSAGGTSSPTGGQTFNPSGWTQVFLTSATAYTPPRGENGDGVTTRFSTLLTLRALSPALSGTVVSGIASSTGSPSSSLYLFRNSKRRQAVITLLDQVVGAAFTSRVVNYGASGSPVIAAIASRNYDAAPTYNGAAFPNKIEAQSNEVNFALQKSALDVAVASAASGNYRAFAVGTQ